MEGYVQSYARELAYREVDNNRITEEVSLTSITVPYWFTDFCIEKLHRLPSEVEQYMTCREYTHLQAYYIVKGAYAVLGNKAQRHAASAANESKAIAAANRSELQALLD